MTTERKNVAVCPGHLALLNSRDNASLSNSSFDVKSLYWDDGSWTVCENDAFVTYWYDEKPEQTVEIVEEL